MNTVQLINKAYDDPMLKEIFLGVFPSDGIQNLETFPSALIINLDTSKDPGSHWVAIYFSNEATCEIFDSFGRKPEIRIMKYITKYVKSYTYNNICVQDLWSVSCGQMCLYFLTWRCRNQI